MNLFVSFFFFAIFISLSHHVATFNLYTSPQFVKHVSYDFVIVGGGTAVRSTCSLPSIINNNHRDAFLQQDLLKTQMLVYFLSRPVESTSPKLIWIPVAAV